MKIRFLALFTALLAALPFASSSGAVGISINFAPPLLPVVEQPYCPVEGYIWTPGYWAYNGFAGYYWVPGVWVPPPRIGLLWTPPYWGFNNGLYVFHDGYWGPRVGFYGGVNYGYGYFGRGYGGGRWNGNVFLYNTAVTRVNKTVIRNTFVDRSVLRERVKGSRASFNGPNGVKAQPTAAEQAAADRRVPATPQQVARREAASKNRDLQAAVNKGQPKREAIKAVERNGQGVADDGNASQANKRNDVPTAARKEKADREAQSRQGEKRDNVRDVERRENRRDLNRPDAGRAENDNRRKAENRERTARADRGAGDAAAAARRDMAARSRRPEAVQPRQSANRGEGTKQQRKKKSARPEATPAGR